MTQQQQWPDIVLRPYRPDDATGCFALFRLAIHAGTSPHYDAAQRAAWAGSGPMGDAWHSRLAAMHTTVAQQAGGIVGFMSLRGDGYLDFAFVHPDLRRSGLAVRLLDRTLEQARRLGLRHLTTDASHLARRFFLKHGWHEVAAQQVQRDGVMLENFRMARSL
ncbi:GNAT family N-acetyltransferase [Oceaniglobus trochenteri]|uniref:GNAT family N-acetyltransferase n=1 Tax=Oceaniglobus trochenteri TaxID=2763260 RepID=UPI001CFFC530|nr:GNAT family N-acetyltransferase [Oceaniglobus trochenteri]